MGYFPNGTSALIYQEQFCARCANAEADYDGCAIMDAHMIYNYDECNKPDSILHMLIPRVEGGENGECNMFRAKGEGE